MSNELPSIQQVMESVQAKQAGNPPVAEGGNVPPVAPETATTFAPAVEPSPEVAVGLVKAAEAPAERPARLFAKAAQAEAQARKRQAEFDARQKEIDHRSAVLSETEKKLSFRKEELQKDPLKFLKDTGISYDDLTRAQLNQYEAPVQTAEEMTRAEIQALKDELKSFREQTANSEKQKAEIEQAQREKWAMSVIEDTVKAGNYEYIATAGENGKQLVRDVIQKYYEINNIQLDFKAACDIVEKHYEDEVVQPYLNTSKIQKYIEAEVSKRLPVSSSDKPATKPKSEPTTLSHRQTATTSTQAVNVDALDRDQAREHLIKKYGLK